ncbi:uncharacterized protein [Physcomitrium patens]|uniref:HTH OST-type domain-containing protein n=1 Tax=Physcomitrium patens TaxID=3218 RepID=A0A7I4CNW0_PHYPA|nr:uncharacterized protein LOC112275934 isoform X2 [Physcomitrium patens]|eukprot:XP_024362501.1 uncharacterized protein LOC112275934 isoform X2 [Physcomitrella patens]
MATPTSILDLPALLVLDKDDLGANGCSKETKKLDASITDNLSLEHHSKNVGEGIQTNLEAKNDAVQGKIRPIQELEDPKKQGLKPSRGEERKSREFKPSRFKDDLEKGIPVESDDHRIKWSVFGFGLSGDQETALFQYITNKSGKMPYNEPDREALAHCWGSPELVREDVDNNELEEDDIPVAFPADLSETLAVKEMVKSGLLTTSVVAVNGENDGLFLADEERLINAENEVDAASTESLYEGEGGVDQGFKSVTVDSLANIEDEEEKHEGPAQVLDNEQMERDLIMQKVKECYGYRVKTSLERALRKGDPESIISSQGLDNQLHTVKSGASQDAAFSGTRKDDMVASPTTIEVPENGSFINLWEDECMTYLERPPEYRARLQYQVRVILISPAFHVAGRTVTAFSSFYEKKFGRTVEASGFSTSARLCRSMPHVVQRLLLIDEGKLQLVDTPKNHRIVAGIRSGLRRIVYEILRTHQWLHLDTIESLCEGAIGQPLHEVLIDHGYHTASVECMLHDMPDIAHLDERAEQTRVYLCKGAEDPALTDGFLLRQSIQERSFVGLAGSISQFHREVSGCKSDLHVEENQQSPDDDDTDERSSPDCSRTGPVGMAPEELSDLRALCAAESNNLGRDASIYNVEDLSPHVRLRLRLLLALHDEGRGIEVECLPSVYEKMFAVPLDLPTLGFKSLQELIDAWRDVMLTQTSNPRWVFPINTLDNNRVLNTITSGLRLAVFAILLARYPAGLEPLELVECLEETLSGKLWEILSSNGYIFKDLIKTGKSLSRSPSEFQLPDCPELRLLLKDMEDFVRLGCREDGVLIVKLRDGEFPLLDLQDCDVSGGIPEGEGEKSDVDAIKETLNNSAASSISSPAKPDDHVVMAMDTQLPARINSEALKAKHHEVAEEGGAVDRDLTPLDMMSSDEQNLASLPTSPTLTTELVVTVQKQSCNPSHKLKHETRMILGSPDYMENGLTIEEFRTVYMDRTGGRPLSLGEFKSIESLLHAMPDIVSFELGPAPDDQIITLAQSRRNMRILSVAKVGLRQVLFWALLRNPGGVWAELLEGWFLDFTGWPLSSVLASHGYDKTRRALLQPVTEFLLDMADIVDMKESDPSLYVWTGLCEGPNRADALLLGVSDENIQYDPVKAENVDSR